MAELVMRHTPTADIQSIHHYADGDLMNTVDNKILREAHRSGWTLVTFDVNTMPRLLQKKAGAALSSFRAGPSPNDHAHLAEDLSSIVRRQPATKTGPTESCFPAAEMC
ncbi:MAG: hypothetical protein WEB53_01350 [Akkermansiaceae bacterium]